MALCDSRGMDRYPNFIHTIWGGDVLVMSFVPF